MIRKLTSRQLFWITKETKHNKLYGILAQNKALKKHNLFCLLVSLYHRRLVKTCFGAYEKLVIRFKHQSNSR